MSNLSIEDIESLGFIKRKKSTWIGWHDYIFKSIRGGRSYYLDASLHVPRYSPSWEQTYKIYLHRYLDDEGNIEKWEEMGESEQVFEGFIIDKTELEKLMQQVGINERILNDNDNHI